jgi:4-amino-4-deoxychorismate lyase
MCLLLETIKIENGKLCDIFYHNLRFNKSRKEFFGCSDSVSLENVLKVPPEFRSGLYKCRIIYSDTVKKIEFLPYQKKEIESLKIVVCDSIEYDYKYEDRSGINKLLELKKNCDDILIVKNKKITDASFSNIVFYDGKKWVTPSSPLLKGTKREKLLSERKIIEDEIAVTDLKHFKKAALINCMLDLGDCVIDIKNIDF